LAVNAPLRLMRIYSMHFCTFVTRVFGLTAVTNGMSLITCQIQVQNQYW
jgi:hypothetical protein